MTEKPQETESDFDGKITGIMMNGLAAFGLELGWKLGLFDALAALDGPKTAREIAEIADLKQRYVEEWLLQMTCLKIVDVSADGRQFFLPEHRRSALIKPSFSNELMKYHVLSWGRLFNEMSECFKKEGPTGLSYSRFEDYDVFLNGLNETKAKLNPHFTDQMIASVPDLIAKLCDGISVCEIGCGHGAMLLELAKENPNSNFIGVECQELYVIQVNQKVKDLKLPNAEFELLDACKLPGDWHRRFDFVFVNAVIHDLSRPDLGLNEIHRILKDDGVFCMVDNFHEPQTNELNAMFYSISLLQCVAPSMFGDGGWGLGCQWKKHKGRELLNTAGFSIISERAAPHPEQKKTLFVCRKV